MFDSPGVVGLCGLVNDLPGLLLQLLALFVKFFVELVKAVPLHAQTVNLLSKLLVHIQRSTEVVIGLGSTILNLFFLSFFSLPEDFSQPILIHTSNT